ncbi:MAG: hypothetical protein IJQ11_07335 [Bacteroidales bacterium]|nr:hypothetical protein [Bacteroidales bacterium]
MTYLITSAFLIAYMVTMWYVELYDSPESYNPFKGAYWSRHWYFVTILTSLVIACLVQFVTSERWLFGVIAFVVICANNFFVYRYKRRHPNDTNKTSANG